MIQSDLDPESYIIHRKQAGKLPLANMGKVLVNDLHNSIQEFSEVLKDLTQGKVQSQLDINYTFDNSKIKGTLPVYDNNYIYITVSTTKLKHYIYPWISYLVAIAQDSAPKLDFTILFNQKRDKGKKQEKIAPFIILYSEHFVRFN